MLKRLRPITLLLETGLLGLFFVQALRYLIGGLYNHIASASLVSVYAEGSYDPTIKGIIDPAIVSQEVILLGLVLALPLLSLLLGRFKIALFLGTLTVILGRALMTFPQAPLTTVMGAEIAVGAGLFMICALVIQRAQMLPYFFVLGFTFDQLIRAFGNTLDPTIFDASRLFTVALGTGLRQVDFFYVLLGLLGLTALAGLINWLAPHPIHSERLTHNVRVDPNRGLLTIWGAIGMSGLLFLELVLLALPNAIMGRAGTELFQLFVVLTLAATLLPIIPAVRRQARNFIAPFDANTRGWIWLILVALLIVIGTRIKLLPIAGAALVPFGGFALILAQFAVSMMWWWLVRPKTEDERNFGGLWMLLMVFLLSLFLLGDVFTYEYAFVRPFSIAGNLNLTQTLNQIALPLLRGFRGLGLALILLAVLLASLPMIQATRRIPWRGGNVGQTLTSIIMVALLAALGWFAARPPVVSGLLDAETLRIGTYNIHAGSSEFYGFTLDDIAEDILYNGVSVVLLQEVEVGRLSSYGVDQSLWLARKLGMDERFFATNEGILGLAVLSRVPIAYHDGVLLPSVDRQTGLQRVQIQPDNNVNSVITLYNTELGFLLLQGDDVNDQESNQVTQLRTILGVIEQHRQEDYGGQLGRLLLGGTFHNVDSAPLMDDLRRYGFNDPFAGTNLTLTATLNVSNVTPAPRFDYLWVWAQSLPQLGVNVVDSNASDHRMAYVEFQIRVDN